MDGNLALDRGVLLHLEACAIHTQLERHGVVSTLDLLIVTNKHKARNFIHNHVPVATTTPIASPVAASLTVPVTSPWVVLSGTASAAAFLIASWQA